MGVDLHLGRPQSAKPPNSELLSKEEFAPFVSMGRGGVGLGGWWSLLFLFLLLGGVHTSWMCAVKALRNETLEVHTKNRAPSSTNGAGVAGVQEPAASERTASAAALVAGRHGAARITKPDSFESGTGNTKASVSAAAATELSSSAASHGSHWRQEGHPSRQSKERKPRSERHALATRTRGPQTRARGRA